MRNRKLGKGVRVIDYGADRTFKIINTVKPDYFTLDSATSTGGKTGSVRVISPTSEIAYQYKPPIAQNKFIRQAKSSFSDTENFGELLAARIAKQFDTDPAHPRVPSIYFVTEENSPYVGIVSQHFQGESVKSPVVPSLDGYLKKPAEKSHIKLVSGKENPSNGIYDINKNPDLKKELALAVAMSAICVDHDVNPGNMMVIENNTGFRIGRIDYGHAFKDLMRFSSFGGKEVHQNNIIDFFNREQIDGLPSSKSKLWRDYPGLVPSLEMADALSLLANQENAEGKIKNALEEVKQEVRDILKQPNIDKEQVIYSLQRISEHVSKEKIDSRLKGDDKINAIFQQIEQYVVRNMKQMAYAAEIMKLQVDIQAAVKNQSFGHFAVLEEKYAKLKKKGESEVIGPFSWIKETDKLPVFKGDFKQYAHYQNNLFKLNNILGEINKFLNNDQLPKHERLIAKALERIVRDPKKSVEDKLALLDKQIRSIDDNPKPKSNILLNLVNSIRNLIIRNRTSDVIVLNPAYEPVVKFKAFKANLREAIGGSKTTQQEESTASADKRPK